jgi:hypothetical protein
MRAIVLARSTGVALLTLAMIGCSSGVQSQEPKPSAIALAKELIELKGASSMWDPVIPGVIEQAKGMFLRTNPALNKDLTDVAQQLRTEYGARRAELSTEFARLYALRFTEPELKDALAFYKTPLGRKIIVEEPKVFEESVTRVKQWTDRFSEEVMGRMRAEMKKRGYTL